MRFAMDDQIASQPKAVSEMLGRDVPELDGDRPIVFTGIGSSLHAARIAASWTWLTSEGRVRAYAVDAHDLALHYPLSAADQVVAISHRGYKRYPTAALRRAGAVGARTIAVVGNDAPGQDAQVTVHTCANETAGTFTVSYLSALGVLGRLVETLGGPGAARFSAALRDVPRALEETLTIDAPVAIAAACVATEPLLIVGFDLDAVTADEAALKIKEGTRLWAEAMSTEFSLHGTPAAFRAGMHAFVLVPGHDDGGRTDTVRELLDRLGLTVWTVGDGDQRLRFAPSDPWMRPFTAVVPFQRLTAELARLRGTDPDTLHGGVEPWHAAMTALEL